MNSDLFTNIDYEDFFLHFQQHDAEMPVAAVPYNISIPFGILDLEGRDIKGLIEKLISQAKKVIRYPLNGTWIGIDTHQEYAKAKDLVKHLN